MTINCYSCIIYDYYTIVEGQTFDPHPHPGGFTKLPERPVASSVAVLVFFTGSGGGGQKASPELYSLLK